MHFAQSAPRVIGVTVSAEKQKRYALEIRESRESLLSTLLALPPVCREHVLKDEAAGGRFLP